MASLQLTHTLDLPTYTLIGSLMPSPCDPRPCPSCQPIFLSIWNPIFFCVSFFCTNSMSLVFCCSDCPASEGKERQRYHFGFVTESLSLPLEWQCRKAWEEQDEMLQQAGCNWKMLGRKKRAYVIEIRILCSYSAPHGPLLWIFELLN